MSSGQTLGRSFTVLAAAVLVCALTLFSFWPALGCQFTNLDDTRYVTANRYVHEGMTSESVAWAWKTTYFGYWIPLTWVSLMLDAQLYGIDAWGFHLTNLLLHVMTAIILMLTLSRGTGSIWRSAATAALFAVHPLRVESVVWVAERKDVLCGLFASLAIWAYFRFAARPSFIRYLPVIVFYLLGLLCKPPLIVTLPIVLWMLDVWPLRRMKTQRTDAKDDRRLGRAVMLALEKLPLAVLSIGAGLLLIITQHNASTLDAGALTLSQRTANGLVAYARYLEKMAWFGNLAPLYPYPGHWPAWQVGWAAALIAGVTVLAVAQLFRRPWLAVGWLWFLIAMFPLSGVAVQAGPQAMADRFTYFSGIGLGMAVIWSIPASKSLFIRLATGGAVAATLVVLCFFTRHQTGYWHDSESLFRRTIQVTGPNWLAESNLGATLGTRGASDEAIGHLVRSLEINPVNEVPCVNLARIFAKRRQDETARLWAIRAIEINPRSASAHVALGDALWHLNRREEAAGHFHQAAELDPSDPAIQRRLDSAMGRESTFEF